MKKVIIIGAGTIGLHSAYYLNKKGYAVEVLDAVAEGDENGCSYGNCGYIVPSHFTPLASPAMLRSGLKMLFDRTSPVHLPLLRSLNKLPFFIRLALSSNRKHVNRVKRLLYELNNESRKLYMELEQLSGQQIEVEERGLIMATTTAQGFKEEIELATQAGELGIETETIDPLDWKRVEPDLENKLKGAVYYKSDAHIHPDKHMRWLKEHLKERGVVFHYNTVVHRILKDKGRISGIETSGGWFSGDFYVLGAGARSSHIAGTAGVRLPVLAGKGYSIDIPREAFPLRTPVILTEARVALTPFKDSIRLGSGMEFNGRLGELHFERIQAMLDRTRSAFPGFPAINAREVRIWEGLRPVSPDGVPFIGKTAKYPELLVATGHAMMGVSLGPVTGRIISELVGGIEPGFDLELLSPGRFGE